MKIEIQHEYLPGQVLPTYTHSKLVVLLPMTKVIDIKPCWRK